MNETTSKKKIEFSKLLAIIITLVFIGTWLIGWVCWFFTKTLPIELLNYITVPFSVVITGYFTKSGVENYTKIKNN